MIQDSRPSLSGMLKVGLQDERKLSALLWSGFLGPFSVNLALIGVTPMDLEAQIPNKHLQTNPNDMFSNKQWIGEKMKTGRQKRGRRRWKTDRKRRQCGEDYVLQACGIGMIYTSSVYITNLRTQNYMSSRNCRSCHAKAAGITSDQGGPPQPAHCRKCHACYANPTALNATPATLQEHVTELCVCDKVVWQFWCETVLCDNVVCERVWESCMCVCENVMCEWVVWRRWRKRRRRRPRAEQKNKNPDTMTQWCGQKFQFHQSRFHHFENSLVPSRCPGPKRPRLHWPWGSATQWPPSIFVPPPKRHPKCRCHPRIAQSLAVPDERVGQKNQMFGLLEKISFFCHSVLLEWKMLYRKNVNPEHLPGIMIVVALAVKKPAPFVTQENGRTGLKFKFKDTSAAQSGGGSFQDRKL